MNSFVLVKTPKSLRFSGAILFGLLLAPCALPALPISVPNASFESQSGVGQPFSVNVLVDSWQKPEKPAYFDFIEANYGIFWAQTAGVFVDNNPYVNRDGAQAAYLLSFPQVALFQDYDTMAWNDASPSHNFNATYAAGQAYNLTLGVNGKGMVDGAMLNISLYYKDDLDAKVTLGSTTVVYSSATFPSGPPYSLTDYQVNVGLLGAGDQAVGRHMGVEIESVYGDGNGYWDVDNVRLEAVPEPGSMALLALGAGGLWLVRRRARSRA